jgi:hypothetical protein
MEETNSKSTAAAEGDDTDQKLLMNRQGRPRAQLGKSPNEMPSEKQLDPDLDLPFLLVRKL